MKAMTMSLLIKIFLQRVRLRENEKQRKEDRENKLGLSAPSTYFRFFIFLPFSGSQAISS